MWWKMSALLFVLLASELLSPWAQSHGDLARETECFPGGLDFLPDLI